MEKETRETWLNEEYNNHAVSLGENADVPGADDMTTMEHVFREIGVPSRYQLIQVVCTSTCVTLIAFSLLNFVFIGYESETACDRINETEYLTKHRSTLFNNDSQPEFSYHQCFIAITSNSSSTRNGIEKVVHRTQCHGGYRYKDGKHVSMATDWDLVCNKRGVAEFVQTAVTLGMAISSMTVTSVADRFGRRNILVVSIGALFLTELGLAFAVNIYMAFVLRFFTGISVGTVFVLHNVINSELNISKYRQTYSACKYLLWSFNLILLAGVAFALRDSNWRHLQLLTAAFGIPVFIATLVVNETPTWYVARGRYTDARRTVIKACKTNGKDTRWVLEKLEKYIANSSRVKANHTGDDPYKKTKYTLFDVIHNRQFLCIVTMLCFVWFTIVSSYFGLYLTSSTLAGNRHLNFFLMTLLEIPSCLVIIPMLVYLGRRTVMIIFIAMSAVCLLVSTCLVATATGTSHFAYASTVFYLLGKFTVGSSYNLIVGYTPELFPTTIRSTGTGLCSCTASVGAMLAPFLNTLFKVVNWAPGAILTSMNFVCLILLCWIPETKGKELPTTMEEIVSWNERTHDSKTYSKA